MIFDFHTHPKYNTTKKFGFDMTDELFIGELKRAGICRAAGSALDLDLLKSSENYGEAIKELNKKVYAFYMCNPEFFVPGIHIHPDFVELSANEIEEYHKKGVKLVGELVPYLMGCDTYISKGFFELFALCSERDMVVSVHPGDVNEMEEIAKNFKNMTLVMAHPSYGDDYMHRLSIVKKYENVYLDLSGTGIAAMGMLRFGIDTVGKEKILFGTDFPGYNPEMYVRSVLYDKLTDEERDYIFYKNACRLLKLEEK